MPNNKSSTPFETRPVLALAAIFSLRMLGLFIILPIFSLYTQQLAGGTTILIGIALGIYGLTQAIFQIPLGMLSDKWGRKPIIAAGLVIFILGSIIAALSTSIYGVILGRALQGAGAVGSTVIALVADLTTTANRTKAMAVIGMSIGTSFAVAIVLAPILNQWIGLSGIFWMTALLGILCIALLLFLVPQPPQLIFHADAETTPNLLKSTLFNPNLSRLNIGIFILHALLTATFIAIPVLLMQLSSFTKDHAWIVYLPGLVFAFIVIIPCIIVAERFHQMKLFFRIAIVLLGLTQLLLWKFHTSTLELTLILLLFFTAFTFLEASLPSLISKMAPIESKGTAMGIYSTAQFLGIFAGGSIGGLIYSHYHLSGIICFNLMLIALWLSQELSFSLSIKYRVD
jgi:predicted MFS family arabinose efflux permease